MDRSLGRKRLLLVWLGRDEAASAAGPGANAPAPCAEGVTALPELSGAVDIMLHALPDLPGASLSPDHLVDVAQRIEDALAAGCDGAIVVQGAETIEESAFLLDLLVGGPKPVVVTPIPRGTALSGAPIAGSLLAAARVAASEEARDLGTLVVAQGRIHAARFVRDVGSGAAAWLRSELFGPIGALLDDRPRFWVRAARLPVLPSYGGPPRPVALMGWAMGDDGVRLASLPMLGYAGAVIEGLGAGHVPQEAVPRLATLAARMPVVLAARSRDEVMVAPGGEVGGARPALLRHGLIAAGCLTGAKARLLLGLALRGNGGQAAAAAAFAPYQ
ncbi:asparaginase domain-containing protein [Roseomonas sp. AR75]|uniref:asparaginase domain-containing protein n=1 Tax=Roseomonas sp. AR75 TaxID=2562311 RepID=UPI0014851D16|nr:asparaginase domain-containing protein [Roseomonas sp. AR75]